MAPLSPVLDAPPPAALDLLGIGREQLARRFAAAGIKPVHAETVWADVHRRLARRIGELERTPPTLRDRLPSLGCAIGTPTVAAAAASANGFTRKFLLRFADGAAVETVLMRFDGRATACVSTQAGCAMGCVFCATGQAGFTRHLAAAEIVAQAVHAARVLRGEGHRLRNAVLMGQGEPLHNYDAAMEAVRLLTDPRGLALAAHRITVSTVGVVPGILRLAEEPIPLSLAVSLHAASDEDRARLVPATRRWPVAAVIDACRVYAAKTGRRVFIEWVMLAGTNDDTANAGRLGRLLSGLPAHVNLIPLNPIPGGTLAASAAPKARAFQRVLRSHGIPSTVRQSRGADIAAACGQLAGSAPGPAAAPGDS
jgi:23S rRNA (adenine2503-C2)-methyltransferase